ncbi:tRNA (adenosine(37)-N6)-threonylcarbamoyltransferase complex dimerization subunit type 1 TsaB [Pseudogracilibacillus sp. SO30301A]|uniref:tRNA (adenosine(37)-N6)-threonylcarbamoyltransferase complex dimerization subunit type 1 TsaB n=1 Tax=Pseudogracilibacillus sp. SO30301A TaxID=3098291 RepID=UPI00300E1219
MSILAIDTSNQVLGLAIMKNETIVAELITNIKKDHSSRLMPAIVDLMKEVEMKPDELHEIIVAYGPGSYTGTRIGVTTAKTLAWALNIPIYTVSSLEVLAANARFCGGYICPFFDARRKTVFTGLYQWNNKNKLQTIKQERNKSMESWLYELKKLNSDVLFLSTQLDSFKEMIISIVGENAIIPENLYHLPKPSNLFILAKQKKETPVHLVSPNYLRITEAEANWIRSQKDDYQHG